ncbi:MAG: GDSL-type esterase/lipase family protein [Candidatus Alcyoniella australis]|nr:GDSL-type esterase/lipase family protein [Candidatus Alcyoniella australis]
MELTTAGSGGTQLARLARGMLGALLMPFALAGGYLAALATLVYWPADPLLLRATPGVNEFVIQRLFPVLLLCGGALFADAALCTVLRRQALAALRLLTYIVFLAVGALAVYFDVPMELVWAGLLLYVVPLRVGQELLSNVARPVQDATKPGTRPLTVAAVIVLAGLCSTLVAVDRVLTWPLIAWIFSFAFLSLLLGTRGRGRAGLLNALVFLPLVLSVPAVIILHANILLYLGLLLGVLLAMQALLILPRIRFANLLLFTLAFGGLLTAEAVVRASPLQAIAKPRGLTADMLEDQRLGWLPLDINQRIYLWDLQERAEKIEIESRAGDERMVILCLGGSSTEGHDVAPKARWTRQLEQRLIESGVNAQVINSGVSGWTSYQLMVMFRDVGRDLEPELVIVYTGNNDYEQSRRGVMTQRQWFETYGGASDPQQVRMIASMQRLLARSSLYNIAVRLAILARLKFREQLVNSPEEYFRNLDELADEIENRGGRIVFVAEATTQHTQAFDLTMEEVARKHSAPFLLIEPLLLADHHWEELFQTYCHYNEYGSAVMARLLAQYLVENGLVGQSAQQ